MKIQSKIPAIKDNRRKVVHYNSNGEYITTYDSLLDASKVTGLPVGNICGNCQGRLKQVSGNQFRYFEDVQL